MILSGLAVAKWSHFWGYQQIQDQFPPSAGCISLALSVSITPVDVVGEKRMKIA